MVMSDPAIDRATRLRRKFRELLASKKFYPMPGGISPIFARMAQDAGYDCFFLAGSQLGAYLLGVADNGFMGLRDLVDHARHVASGADIPVLVDCDTGFGNAVNAYYAVQQVIGSGVAGMQIEDQEAPKKSSIGAGRRVIPVEEALGKYKAAVAARDALAPDFVLCARCDTLGAEGGTFEEAVQRCIRYVKEGGVDFVWLNSIESREQIREACARIPAPVMTVYGGPYPRPSLQEYEDLGLRINLYIGLMMPLAANAVWHALKDFKVRGEEAILDRVNEIKASPFGAVNMPALTGEALVRELEQKFIPADQQRDYAATWGHPTYFEGEGDAKKDGH
jgi:2-methylisocitrate lyase-like PEP mutase family enzyme